MNEDSASPKENNGEQNEGQNGEQSGPPRKTELPRLSIIVAAERISPFRRAFIEKTLQNLLSLPDPIGIEVLVMDDSPSDELSDYFGSIFSDALRKERLRLAPVQSKGDPAAVFNEGARRALGKYLAFVMAGDEWHADRLTRLQARLKGKKLDFSGHWQSRQGPPSDWKKLITELQEVKRSSVVITTELFQTIGGFPEGYTGLLLPKRIPGQSDFELVLKAIRELMKHDEKEGFSDSPPEEILLNELQKLPPALERIERGMIEARELVSLIRTGRKLPFSFWPGIGKRILEGRKIFGAVRKPNQRGKS